MEVLPPDPLNQVRSQSEYRCSLWRSMFQDIRIGIGGGAEGLLAEIVCLLSGPFLPCLTILLSDLIFYHDGASVSSHRSHDYATSVKLSSTSSALGHFGYRLIACPPFFHATWFYIHDSRAISRELKQPHYIFEFGAIALVLFHVANYPPEFIRPTPIPVTIKTSQGRERAGVRNWFETMQVSGMAYRLCRASFLVRPSAHLSAAPSQKK